MSRVHNKAFVCAIDLDDLTEIYQKFGLPHPDSPSEHDLAVFRKHLPVKDPDMVSLHWLRNKIVYLRKRGSLTKSASINKSNPLGLEMV